jgi:hypothetical protein
MIETILDYTEISNFNILNKDIEKEELHLEQQLFCKLSHKQKQMYNSHLENEIINFDNLKEVIQLYNVSTN